MSNCSHDCGNCSANCGERTAPQSLIAPMNQHSDVRHVIGIVSGKGGVGKSLVTSLLASAVARAGKKTAILDADITGPSIPKVFGVSEKAMGSEDGIFPALSKKGQRIMSINLLLEDESSPVVWRGPVIAGTVKQFWTDVIWGDVDYMFVDMPPGTGDVPLTVFQSLPLSGIIIVTSPQELVSLIVEKAAKMADMMDIPVLGLIENMSYISCPDCGKKIEIFGKSHAGEIAMAHGVPLLAQLPINPAVAAACDAGDIESVVLPEMQGAVDKILSL